MHKQSSQPSLFASLAAVALLVTMTVASGVAYRADDREVSTQQLQEIVKSMASFPQEIDSWRQTSAPEMRDAAIRELQCEGFVNRVFENRPSSRIAHALILLGPPGTISAHTPEVCYATRDYEILGDSERITLTGGDGDAQSFWLTRVRRRDASAQVLRVYHAWSTDATWRASSNPRIEFTFAPRLFKSQIAFHEIAVHSGYDEEHAFLQGFVRAAADNCFPETP